MRSRLLPILTLMLALAFGATALLRPQDATAAPASGLDTGAEQDFVARINALRQSKGLAALAIDPELVTNARNWSHVMADAGSIFHASDLSVGVSTSWELLGENVGVGGDVATLFDAFVASPTHYANIVDPSFKYIGVGVLWQNGRMWTVQRYRNPGTPAPVTSQIPEQLASAEPTTAAPEPEPTTTTPPTSTPPTSTPPTSARASTVDRVEPRAVTSTPAAADRPAVTAPRSKPEEIDAVIDAFSDLLAMLKAP